MPIKLGNCREDNRLGYACRIGAMGKVLAAPAMFAVAALCAMPVPVMAERLVEAVRSALRSNPEVRGAAANARAAAETYQQASAGRLPTVDLRVGGGKEQ